MLCITLIATITGPIAAVLITLWHQDRKERRDMERNLFITLMAYRRAAPIAPDWVNALNLIDVVFDKHPKVTGLWHEYYAMLHDRNRVHQEREHKYLDLLAEMGRAVGYKNLKQTDIDKFYSPKGVEDQTELKAQISTELLRVLQSTRILTLPSIADSDGEQEQR